ncbi:MAG: hypothetical protein J5I53_05350 [Bradyrhizobiaceae bacterium]|nr:hypothetical protein [Bradyrhizobiaceae bacterium]
MFHLLLILAGLYGHPQCLSDMFPIGEKELLEPQKRWLTMEEVADDQRQHILKFCGYADTVQQISDEIGLFTLASCPIPTEEESGVTVVAYLIRGVEGDKDENVWLVTKRDSSLIARTLVAQLQTNCSSTYLRGCSMLTGGSIGIQQLQHNFDCDSDEFQGTTHFPSFTVVLHTDGTFEDVFPADSTVSPSEAPVEE